jgi:hypothetical protein
MHDSEQKVVVGNEDIKNIEEFFDHFHIPIPQYLRDELDKFKNNPGAYTVDMQKKLKTELAHAVVSSDHELLKDEVFGRIINNCDKEWFDTQFNRDLEDALTDDED